MAKVFIEETTLSAIGDAIRTKTETTELINPADMAEKIEGISVGSAAVVEPLSITTNGTYNAPEGIDGYTPITVNVPQDGAPTAEELTIKNGNYTFAYGVWDWFIEKYGNQITTLDLGSVGNMFYSSEIKTIPFDLNFYPYSKGGHSIQYAFINCEELLNIPAMNNLKPSNTQGAFENCKKIREFPDNFCDTWDWSYLESLTSGYSGNISGMLNGCRSLRKIPEGLIEHVNPYANNSYTIQYSGFTNCYVLSEIVNLAIATKSSAYTSNSFNNTFTNCSRLKRFTFKMNEGGTPFTVQWKSQIIDLTKYVGYVYMPINATNYNSGITEDTRITDDATYQALKDNEDNWTTDINYSRYNRTSAVETINSLPDASAYLATAGGTNTIKFKGAAGALTDGGAINTMTEEEIAVAVAKGWTVSFA